MPLAIVHIMRNARRLFHLDGSAIKSAERLCSSQYFDVCFSGERIFVFFHHLMRCQKMF